MNHLDPRPRQKDSVAEADKNADEHRALVRDLQDRENETEVSESIWLPGGVCPRRNNSNAVDATAETLRHAGADFVVEDLAACDPILSLIEEKLASGAAELVAQFSASRNHPHLWLSFARMRHAAVACIATGAVQCPTELRPQIGCHCFGCHCSVPQPMLERRLRRLPTPFGCTLPGAATRLRQRNEQA